MADTAPARSMPKKPTPLEAFELNMGDAVWMTDLAEALANQRTKGIYSSTRERLGDALRLSQADRAAMDVAESDDFYVIIKRGSTMSRDRLQDRTALLRHAVVAACAATETYFADKLIALVRPMLRTANTATNPLPRALRELPLTLGDLVDLDHNYQRTRHGLSEKILVPHIQRQSSVEPDGLVKVLALAGQAKLFTAIDAELGWEKGTCNPRMSAIAKRRNVIAHTGDRKGRGRNTLTTVDTRAMTDDLTAIVHAADKILSPAPPMPRRPDRSEAVYTALTRCPEPITAGELAELAGAPKTTIAALLSKWCNEQDDDAPFPHVERVERGKYLYNP